MKKFFVGYIGRLFFNIKVLGIKKGFAYWKYENKTLSSPEFVLQWAASCEKEANRCNLRGDKESQEMFEDWAMQLRKCVIDKKS